MSLVVIDASVAVKWIIPEEHSEAARGLLAGPHELFAPPLISLEIANVMLKRVRRRELSKTRAANAIERIERWLPTQDVEGSWGATFALAERCQISAYDASYVGLALQLSARLITADRRLVNALSASLPGIALLVEDVADLD